MEIEQIIKGIELPEEAQTKLKENLDKFSTTISEQYKKDLAEANSKLEEAIESRQKTKSKLSELENKMSNGQAELKELLEAKNKEIESLSTNVSDYKSQFEATQKQIDEIKEKQRQALLESLEGENKKFAESLDLEKLQEYAKIHSRSKVADPKARLKLSKDGDKPKTAHEWRARNLSLM